MNLYGSGETCKGGFRELPLTHRSDDAPLAQVGESRCIQSQEIAKHLVGVLTQTRRAERCRLHCPLDMKRRANQVHRVPLRITYRQLQPARRCLRMREEIGIRPDRSA